LLANLRQSALAFGHSRDSVGIGAGRRRVAAAVRGLAGAAHALLPRGHRGDDAHRRPLLARKGAATFRIDGCATEQPVPVLVQEVGTRAPRLADPGMSAFIPVRAGTLVRTRSGKIR
jgi:hypothetical protein